MLVDRQVCSPEKRGLLQEGLRVGALVARNGHRVGHCFVGGSVHAGSWVWTQYRSTKTALDIWLFRSIGEDGVQPYSIQALGR